LKFGQSCFVTKLELFEKKVVCAAVNLCNSSELNKNLARFWFDFTNFLFSNKNLLIVRSKILSKHSSRKNDEVFLFSLRKNGIFVI